MDITDAMWQELAALVNSGTSNIEGWVLFLAGMCGIHFAWEKCVSAISWWICAIIFCQSMYIFSTTGMNDLIPLSHVFKYDILSSFVRTFDGTRAGHAVGWFNAYLTFVLTSLWNKIGWLAVDLAGIFGKVWESIYNMV
jgi:hypothetical protein